MVPDTEYNGIPAREMLDFLEEKYRLYNTPAFIENDPVSIPHRYTNRQDIEIAGFLAATIAWGRRDLIIKSASRLIGMMGNNPWEFILEAKDKDIQKFNRFYYRTFNGTDCTCFIRALKKIYLGHNSMEDIIASSLESGRSLRDAIGDLRAFFFSIDHERRTRKHFADVAGGAAGKRINMFLRWMVRNDNRGVDFGLWNRISPSLLYIPLDLHSGNTARRLGLLTRKANDWKAVEELTGVLRRFDNDDPAKYDFSLFGIGINEGI